MEEETTNYEEELEQYVEDDGTEYTGPGEQEVEKPTKDEFKVAKWMRANIKSKKTKFLSHNVTYFISNKAVDALLKSKFAQGDDALFTTREQAIEYLDMMLEHKFFHRAKKVPVSLEELRGSAASAAIAGKTTKNKGDDKEHKNTSGGKKEKDEKKDTEAEAEASGGNNGNGDGNISAGAGGAGGEKKEKRKRKIRLDMHPEQIFVDGSEAYIWIYDPIPLHYWIYGLILLLGAILICLFPLWPPLLRKGVYYLSVAAAGFLVVILALTVVRLIVFTLVWLLSYGKLHFWLLPNLTEDVGFFASFWPLYESNYIAEEEKSKPTDKRSKSKSKKKEKDSDAEEDTAPEAIPLEPEKIEEVKEHDADMELRHRNVAGDSATTGNSEDGGENSETAVKSDAKGSHTPSESDSEISGKDQFEIISSSEVHNVN
ncbi:translocation protein SEC62 isoform X1 [Ceratitis capitata]|uniref:translocation protein SEC62 isoform X1 n=1 Tax=Ceratitis capitata TaxID=7213 RepID=UPI0006188BF9|nr:translocation protein SEC62 isoform X1 [Ceratitis capitata]